MVRDTEMRYKKILDCIKVEVESYGVIKEMSSTYEKMKEKIN